MAANGEFVWYDLMTTDTKAAQAFYSAVIGWTMTPYDGGMDYTVLNVAGGVMGVGGMMGLTPEMLAGGARPGWIGYINVDDCDAYTDKLVAAGGKVMRPPNDIPSVGRFSVVADPQGAVFQLFQVLPRPAPPGPAADAPGMFGWRELMAAEMDSALAFYVDLLGWTKGPSFDMGAHGMYQLAFTGDAAPSIGIMNKPDFIQAPPFWTYYINVDGAQAAVDRVKAAGGTIINGPQQVPTGQWIAQATDPQGGAFGMLSVKP
jgi:predicted enzyme related to lactoylglutathione lyase